MADRWAPWIEAPAAMTVASSPLVVNGTGFGAIPGCTVTFTPHVDTRLSIPIQVEATYIVAAAGNLVVRLSVNGVGVGLAFFWKAMTVGERTVLCGVRHLNLLKDTTYTLAMEARLDALGPTYHILATSGGIGTQLGPITAMPNLH